MSAQHIARNVVGRLHVSATSRDVVKACHKAIKKPSRTRAHRSDRHIFIRMALKEHADNRGLFQRVMRGN
jgi:hypothetical protein